MRFSLNSFTLPTLAFITAACQPAEKEEESAQNSTVQNNIQSTDSNNESEASRPAFETIKLDNITLNLVSFDSRLHSLQVADQSKGLGKEWEDAKSAASDHSAIAAINGGFFTPEEKPLGLVIENGVTFGSFNRSSLGAGIFYNTGSSSAIVRSSQWKEVQKSKPKQLLQSGPMLVEDNSSTKGLSDSSSRVRSFIAWDGKNRWCIGHASACTLRELGLVLEKASPNGWKISTALNLDGGRSSDLWVSSALTDTGSALIIRPFWNKPVRNFLVLKTK